MFDGISGAVLAGGRGVRMGMDKALIRLDGETLLQRVVARVSTLTEEVLVVGRDSLDPSLPARAVPDCRPGTGSLGGIYTALREARGTRCLIVGCDMPFLNRRLLSYLIDLSPAYDVVIPRLDGLVEPLHAVYAKACLEPIADLLDRGDLRIYDFFDRVRVRYVERGEITVFDPDLLSFFNINTPEQLQQARAMIRRLGG